MLHGSLNMKEDIYLVTLSEARLLATAFLSAFAQGLMSGPLFALFSQQLGGNILEIAGGWSLYQCTTGLLVVAVGWWTGSCVVRTQWLLVVGYALNALVYVSYALVKTPAQLLFVQACLGVAMSLTSPTWSYLFGKTVQPAQACRLWGIANGGYYLLVSLGGIVGALIIQMLSWTALFVLMGTLMAGAALNQHQTMQEIQ